jgi:hypothetical protein
MAEKKQQDQNSTSDQNDTQNDTQQQPAIQQQAEQAPATQQNPVSSVPLAPENNPLVPKEDAKEEPKKLDETVPGGRYKTPDGRTVNANGEELK